MSIVEKLSSLSNLNQEYLSTSVDISDEKLIFKCPIRHLNAELSDLDIPILQDIPRFKTQKPPHPKVKNILAIASGKGGVGKSTMTYYLALALSHMGAKVGVLDADIYGPSQSLLFNLDKKPSLNDQNQFIPYEKHGVHVMSIGVLSQAQQAVMWRGPMISQGLLQLYQKTDWPELDYLLIDLPPGTGDIALTLIQKMPLTAAILVSHPHPLTKLDVDKCAHMFTHLNIPILGTIQNQTDSEGLSIPHDPIFQSMEPIAHPAMIQLAQTLTQKLTQYPVRNLNPFDTMNVVKTES